MEDTQEDHHSHEAIAEPDRGNNAAKYEKDKPESSLKLDRSHSDGSKAGKVV